MIPFDYLVESARLRRSGKEHSKEKNPLFGHTVYDWATDASNHTSVGFEEQGQSPYCGKRDRAEHFILKCVRWMAARERPIEELGEYKA